MVPLENKKGGQFQREVCHPVFRCDELPLELPTSALLTERASAPSRLSTASFYVGSVRGVNPMVVINDLWSMPAQVGTDSPEFILSTLLLSQLALRKGKIGSGLPAPAWVNHTLGRRGVSGQLLLSAAPIQICRGHPLGGTKKGSIGKDN